MTKLDKVMMYFTVALISSTATLTLINTQKIDDLRDQLNAQTVQLNEIITHIDGLNKSQNDILTYCNMGD